MSDRVSFSPKYKEAHILKHALQKYVADREEELMCLEVLKVTPIVDDVLKYQTKEEYLRELNDRIQQLKEDLESEKNTLKELTDEIEEFKKKHCIK